MKYLFVFIISIFLLYFSPVQTIAETSISFSDEERITVLISAYSTPDKLETLKNEMKNSGILMEINQIKWNAELTQILEIDFTIQHTINGRLAEKMNFVFTYNTLTQGQILLIPHSGGIILADAQQIFSRDFWNIVQEENDLTPNTVLTSYSAPFSANDKQAKRIARDEAQSYFKNNLALVYQIRKERNHGLNRYMYRYYYNGQRLAGSTGINSGDMTSHVYVGNDADGVLSLFVESEVSLSPFAVLED